MIRVRGCHSLRCRSQREVELSSKYLEWINIVYKLNNQIYLGSVNLPDFAAVIDTLQKVLYEKEPPITQDFRRHRGLKPDLRSTIRDPRGLVVIAERAAVDARVEPLADQASALLEAEGCLCNQGL